MTHKYTFRSKNLEMIFISLDDAIQIVPTKNMALISLNDPELKPEVDYSLWKHCLRLRFNDVSHAEDGVVFSSNMATSVFEFVAELPKEVSLLVIHCFQGISRSAAVVKFLSRYIFPQCFNQRFDTEYDHFNKLVYDKLCRTWKARKSQ